MSEIPSWVGDLIGIPYLPLGRDPKNGIDCFGLVRHVLNEHFDCAIQDCLDYSEENHFASGAKKISEKISEWQEVKDPRPGDVALFRIRGMSAHIGIIIAKGWILHTHQGTDSHLIRTDHSSWMARLEGFYRHESAR